MKLLTISIAAYNVEHFLHNTLSSLVVEKLLMELLEIIVQDDGSHDKTLQIAEDFQQRFPKSIIVNHCGNGGYGATINRSIKMATGKYFKQLDGDDWFDTNNLKDFILYLKNIDADFIITPYYECFEDGRSVLIDQYKHVGAASCRIQTINMNKNLLMHELTIKTDLLKDNKISITEHCFYTDNEYTFLPLLYAKTVARFAKPIYCYRLGREGQSVSVEGYKKHYKDTIVVAEKLFSQLALTKKESLNEVCEIIDCKLVAISDSVYTSHLIVKTKEAKESLFYFDRRLEQKFPRIYRISNKFSKIKWLRKSNFLFFEIIANIILRKKCRSGF